MRQYKKLNLRRLEDEHVEVCALDACLTSDIPDMTVVRSQGIRTFFFTLLKVGRTAGSLSEKVVTRGHAMLNLCGSTWLIFEITISRSSGHGVHLHLGSTANPMVDGTRVSSLNSIYCASSAIASGLSSVKLPRGSRNTTDSTCSVFRYSLVPE